MCVAAPFTTTTAEEFPHADSQRQAHPSQESIQIGVRVRSSEDGEESLDASWFTDEFGDAGLVQELQSNRIPRTHDAESYRRWINSEVMRESVSEGYGGQWYGKERLTGYLKKYVDKAVLIGQGMLRRGDSRAVVVMTTIGPNTHEEAIEFRDFNKVDGRPMATPAEFGAMLRQANREMIREFGMDGSRLFVSNMEPSTQQFGDVFPDWQPTPVAPESCVAEVEKHCKHNIGTVNRCTKPIAKGCYGQCEEHSKLTKPKPLAKQRIKNREKRKDTWTAADEAANAADVAALAALGAASTAAAAAVTVQ